MSKWIRALSCYILVKNMASALVQKHLPEAKQKSFGLTASAEEISNSLVLTVFAWLRVTIFMQIYVNEQTKQEQDTKCTI